MILRAHKPNGQRPPEPDEEAVRKAAEALEKGFAQVQTPEQAQATLDELERASQDVEEQDVEAAEPEAGTPRQEAAELERTVDAAPARDKAEVAIEETATRMAAAEPREEAALDEAVAEVGAAPAQQHAPISPEAERGRNLLRQEMIKRLRPFDAVDTVLYLHVNQIPHPPKVDKFMHKFSYLMTGGWAWLLVPILAAAFGNRRKAMYAAVAVAPALWLATSTVEYPVKRFFRRRRPFTAIVRAIVVGQRAASFSFPSGHSAAAWAGAILLRRYFPGMSPAFYTVALLVSFSRVYLGAHYPGDVATGGLVGAALAKMYHGLWMKVARRFIPFMRG